MSAPIIRIAVDLDSSEAELASNVAEFATNKSILRITEVERSARVNFLFRIMCFSDPRNTPPVCIKDDPFQRQIILYVYILIRQRSLAQERQASLVFEYMGNSRMNNFRFE